jgi:hypothetical protein
MAGIAWTGRTTRTAAVAGSARIEDRPASPVCALTPAPRASARALAASVEECDQAEVRVIRPAAAAELGGRREDRGRG